MITSSQLPFLQSKLLVPAVDFNYPHFTKYLFPLEFQACLNKWNLHSSPLAFKYYINGNLFKELFF